MGCSSIARMQGTKASSASLPGHVSHCYQAAHPPFSLQPSNLRDETVELPECSQEHMHQHCSHPLCAHSELLPQVVTLLFGIW